MNNKTTWGDIATLFELLDAGNEDAWAVWRSMKARDRRGILAAVDVAMAVCVPPTPQQVEFWAQ